MMALFAATFINVAVWITAALGLIAIAVTAELAVRPYATNAADRLLLSCGAAVTSLILIGLVLNLTPWGLTKTTWSSAWLIVSAGILIWRRERRTKIRPLTAREWTLSAWVISASLIFGAAAVLAITGVRHANQQPDLAISVISRSAHTITVEIEATSTTGGYQITATSNQKKAHRYSSPVISVRAGGNGERIQERLPVNVAGIWTIDLLSADNGSMIRQLKVDTR
jgi:hypothetical protein